MRQNTPLHGFTLIELLVVISIIALLVGITLPALSMARNRAVSATCMSNLHQLGLVMSMYHNDFDDLYPAARYMPPPMFTSDTDPPLTDALSAYLPINTAETNRIYHCPGDDQVFPLTGSSYSYFVMLSGTRLEDALLVRWFDLSADKVWVLRDHDGGTFDLEDTSQISVPFFHVDRNFLFADGHVSLINLDTVSPP